jgi:hypothetical protein
MEGKLSRVGLETDPCRGLGHRLRVSGVDHPVTHAVVLLSRPKP